MTLFVPISHTAVVAGVALLLAAPVASAQRLTLADALDRADRWAYGNRAQTAAARAQRAQSMLPLRGILPTVRFDAGFMRTTDPIGAFGTTLRQRAITQQDFDPSRLNFPPVASNYTGAVVLEQPLFNADAFAGRRAASHAGDAAVGTAEWARTVTRVDVVRAYYGAALAREKVTTLLTAVRAATEHVRQAELMAQNGLVTPSDALLAAVKAGEVETSLLEARGESFNARRALATLLGAPNDTLMMLPDGLPASEAIRALAAEALDAQAGHTRPDVDASRAQAEAAASDALRAKLLSLPRLNGFARYDWNSVLRPYGGDKNWSVGVMASWTLFAGASELAERRITSARRAGADAMRDGVEAKAMLEIEQSTTSLRTAIARLAIAERGVKQSGDAHRIVSRRYAGGLAAVVELLDAAAIETQTRLGHAASRYTLIVAIAERRKALGLDPGIVRSLDNAPVTALSQHEP